MRGVPSSPSSKRRGRKALGSGRAKSVSAPACPGPWFGITPLIFQLLCAPGQRQPWHRDHAHPCSCRGSAAGGLAQVGGLGPPSSSFETLDRYSHPQLKVPAPFPPQIRFPPRFCFAGTELLIGFVLLIFQLLQIWAGSALPTCVGAGTLGTPGTRTCLPASLHPLIPLQLPHPPAGLSLELLSRVLGSHRRAKITPTARLWLFPISWACANPCSGNSLLPLLSPGSHQLWSRDVFCRAVSVSDSPSAQPVPPVPQHGPGVPCCLGEAGMGQ